MSTFDFSKLPGLLIKSGAPILGTVLGTAVGGPLGGAIGGALGGAIGGGEAQSGGGVIDTVIGMAAEALGVDANGPAVQAAVDSMDPEVLKAKFAAAEADAAARWPALAQIAVANAEVAKAQIAATEARMRDEMLAAQTLPGRVRVVMLVMQTIWRPLYAIEGLVECAFFALFIYRVLNDAFLHGNTAQVALLNALLPVLTVVLVPYMGFRFSLLGYYMKKRSDEKVARLESAAPAAGGLDLGRLLDGFIALATRRG